MAARAACPAAASALQPRGPLSRGAHGPAGAPDQQQLFAVLSSEVQEEAQVPGHGSFTAYADGRVRACFDDRTLLVLGAAHSHCRAVLPDGRATVVSVSNPVGVEPYVAAVLEFASWSFKTPAERGAELRSQGRVRAELLASQRMAQLCDYAASGALPGELRAGDGAEDDELAAAGEVRALEGADTGWRAAGEEGSDGMGEREREAARAPPFAAGTHDMQAAIAELLARNARLLERLG